MATDPPGPIKPAPLTPRFSLGLTTAPSLTDPPVSSRRSTTSAPGLAAYRTDLFMPEAPRFGAPVQPQALSLGLGRDPLPRVGAPEPDRWKLRLNASHAFTRYWSSDLQIRSSRYNVRIDDYAWKERGSREFFLPTTWMQKGNNPAQILDEPANTYTLSAERNGHEFFFSAFHPKYFQDPTQVKHIVGTIDGVAVDAMAPVNRPFDGYNQTPGESEIVRNESTYREMQWELGYGRRFTLLEHPRLGSLTYRPSISTGIMTGNTYSSVIAKDAWWDYESHLDPYQIQGFGGSVGNRLEWNTPRGRFGIFYENKISYYRLETGFLDGTQRYDLGYTSNNVGLSFMLYNPANHRRR